ncbi:hypothetical protein [Actinophytocola sp.]|jgi:hypothetical protein|uniref:hypothetical protein n=1 Tax=Actinophytocola sp. TaxID=1872138 RepID=UPI002ED7A22D
MSDTAVRAPDKAGRRFPKMPPPVRKAVLVLHVLSAVSWLGLTIGNMTLSVTATATTNPAVQVGLFHALDVFGEVLMIPVAWTAFATGLLVSLGTHWGLVRHKWVLTKFLITSVTVLLTTFLLTPGFKELGDIADRTPPGQLVDQAVGDTMGLIAPGIVSGTCYLTCLVLSIYKPWGRTRWGKRAGNR